MNQRIPTLKVKEVVRVLELLGFRYSRQNGSHAFYKHPDGRRTTVPIHSGDLPRPLFQAVLKQIEMTEEDIRNLL